MLKIIRYTFFDLIRSSWTYFYFGFYLILSSILLFLNHDISKSVITLMNVIIVLIPLISTIFGVMYYYNAREFIELLLAQPIPRKHIFLGQYLGISLSLSLSLVIGLGVPFLLYGLFLSSEIFNFLMLIVTGVFLSFIFVGISYLIGLYYENKIKGFSLAIFIWLFMAVIFDGIFLICFMVFRQYPLDSFFLILLKLDISALMGYTSAFFKSFFGSTTGIAASLGSLSLWVIAIIFLILRKIKRKDF